MTRYFSPRIELLEDRCVPAVDLATVDAAIVDGAAAAAMDAAMVDAPVDDTSFVIDVYLNDPSAAPSTPDKPIDFDQSVPIPDSYWSDPTAPIDPIDSPFWY